MLLKRLARCCCEMSASASRRDNTDRSLARSAWESVPRKNRPVGYGMIGRSESQRYFSSTCAPCFSFSFRIRNFVTPIIESVRTPARITPYPTGRHFWVAIGVGTKVGFAPPSEPDWQFSCIRLSSWWLTFKKISRRILLNFKVRSVVVSRYRGGR